MTLKSLSKILFIMFFVMGSNFAQNFNLKGLVVDSIDGSGLPGASISLVPARSDQKTLNMLSGLSGEFEFKLSAPGGYLLKISFVGYLDYVDSVRVTGKQPSVDLGKIKLKRSSVQMKEVDITGTAIPTSQSEDTLSFTAKGYKTNPDATAEDLVTKLPGVQQEQGTLKAQGEEVKEILVDGQPFFGEDPTVTLKNLPADLIEKIEIFDKLSDQARFTGFDDGQTSKTINIVTKRDRRNGQFGKLYGGYGSTEKFQSGGVINFFGEGRRVSLLGMANNVNQQNFSQQDLLGISQGGGSGGQRGGFQGRGGGHGGGRGGNVANNFLIGAMEGNTKTYSFGLNYQENWGKDASLTGSYFFNHLNNNNVQTIDRDYYSTPGGLQKYNESSLSNSKNFNHRLNLRFEYNIDSMNMLMVRPRLSFQSSESGNSYLGISSFGNASGNVNSTDNLSTSDGNGYNFNNEMIYRRRFETQGRSISLSLNNGLSRNSIDRNQYSINRYVAGSGSSTGDTIDQKGDNLSKGYNYSAQIVYTEPIGSGQLQLNLNAGLSNNFSNRETWNFNSFSSYYDLLDSISTNKYDNDYYTYRAGLGYRLRADEISLNLSVNYQISQLNGNQSFPVNLLTEKSFYNFLPSLRFNYKISDSQNFRIFYNTNVNSPSITQLQNYYDVTNPLFIRAGNPDLKQEFSHRMSTQYVTTDKATGANLFLMLFYQITNDYVGSSSFTAVNDTTIATGVLLKRGSQFSYSKNFDQSKIFRTMFSGGLPVSFLKSNISLNAGFSYQTIPSEYQSVTSESKVYAFNQGITVASNISEDIDFKVTYTPSYFISKNESLPDTDDEYWVHSLTGGLFLNVFDLFFIRSDYALYKTVGIVNDGDVTYSLWNAGIGVKFLENDAAELRLDVFDILDQNNSFVRTATDIYIENKTTQVLKQYFMLTFTYNLKAF